MMRMSQNVPHVIFINSHPIQYFVPLYQYLNQNNLNTECWYCSDENVKGHYDKQFNTRVEWDIPLFSGYTARFFKNRSWKASLYNGFFGLINPGLLWSLFRTKKSVVVVHGWNYFTHLMAIIVARIAGHTVCIRGESPFNQEMMKSGRNKFLKKIFLDQFLFRFANRILFIGTQNRDFYRYYGVSLKKLVFAPYAVDNDRFRKAAASITKAEARRRHGIPADAFVILFTAKLINKKRPMDLLTAYHLLNIPGKCLMMVGDGELRGKVEAYIRDNNLPDVILTGFVNQTEITDYYASADVFVLCSGEGETWGLSVNEAMNFDLPVVVSRTAGCAEDLVTPESGFAFETGSAPDLAAMITACRENMGRFEPSKVIDNYSYEKIKEALITVA